MSESNLKIARWKKKHLVCDKCGRLNGNGDKKITKHHIIPLGKGGKDEWDNIQWLCLGCHKKLHNGRERTPEIEVIFKNIYLSLTYQEAEDIIEQIENQKKKLHQDLLKSILPKEFREEV